MCGFEKDDGTFATLSVYYVSFSFENGLFDNVMISSNPVIRRGSDALEKWKTHAIVLDVLVDLWNLTLVDKDESTSGESDSITFKFKDSSGNILKYVAIFSNLLVTDFFYFQAAVKE